MSNGSRYDKRKEKDNMTKKQRALIVIERLREAYPDADCTLEYEEAWKLLVSVRLAAQCTVRGSIRSFLNYMKSIRILMR